MLQIYVTAHERLIAYFNWEISTNYHHCTWYIWCGSNKINYDLVIQNRLDSDGIERIVGVHA